MEKIRVIILAVVVAISSCVVTGIFMYNYMNSKETGNELRIGTGNYEAVKKYMDIGDLEKIIMDNYYKKPEEAQLVSGALKGMVNSLHDPFSVYYSEEEFKEYNEQNASNFVSIGATVVPYKNSGHLLVKSVYKGSPAEEAGLIDNDIITDIDGTSLTDMDHEGAMSMLRGPSGSTVKLGINSGTDRKALSIVRKDVDVQTVSSNMVNENIGYITINEFKSKTPAEFVKALEFIDQSEATGLIIDVRSNMLGNIKDVVDVLDEIVPEGLLAYTLDKDGQRTEWLADAEYNDIPLVVLVDEYTSSGAEIFAGAIQDRNRGKLIGQQTYGKGVMQAVIDMPYSGGGVKLTNAVFYTPNGNTVYQTGLIPNEVVELPTDITKMTFDTDTQLKRALEILNEEIGGSEQ